MNIKPLGDRVLIEPESLEKDKTRSGIYLPDIASKEQPEKGRVVAVGTGKLVKRGDIVLFVKYSPNELKIKEKNYLIAREEDILAIFK